MSVPCEVEVKLELDLSGGRPRGRRKTPAGLPAGGETRHLTSRYFDTAARSLRKRGYVFRIREDGERCIQTVKAAGNGVFERPEWESEIAGDQPDLAAIADRGCRDDIASLGKLAPIFETSIERTTWRVARGSSEIELALDEGQVMAGASVQQIREIEIELKEGEPSDLFGLAREIAAVTPVKIGVRSKSERGYDLLRPRPRDGIKAEPVVLEPGGDAGMAFQAVARGCLRHFRLNEPGIVTGRAPEALHQARVALRRLRSAFTLFKDVIAGPESERLKRDLRGISQLLGEARNLDVYRDRTLAREAARDPEEPGLAELTARIGADRERAYDRVVRRLASRRSRLAMLELMAFVETGPWLSDEDHAKARSRPAQAFAARVLNRRWRKVRKLGRHLDELDPPARHRVRIEAKKLRYASEFFASLIESRKAKRNHKAFVGVLQELQESLGDLNDIATGHEMARALAQAVDASGDSPPPPTLLFAAGHVSGERDAGETALLASAAAAHRKLRHAKPFWT